METHAAGSNRLRLVATKASAPFTLTNLCSKLQYGKSFSSRNILLQQIFHCKLFWLAPHRWQTKQPQTPSCPQNLSGDFPASHCLLPLGWLIFQMFLFPHTTKIFGHTLLQVFKRLWDLHNDPHDREQRMEVQPHCPHPTVQPSFCPSKRASPYLIYTWALTLPEFLDLTFQLQWYVEIKVHNNNMYICVYLSPQLIIDHKNYL